jgi:hypothetical protein
MAEWQNIFWLTFFVFLVTTLMFFGFWQRRKTALEQIEKDPNSDLVDVYKNIRQLRAFVVCVNQISSRSLVSKWHSSAILDRGRVVFVGCQT